MAYAALLSLTRTLEEIQCRVHIISQVKQQIETLRQGANVLQDFFESSSQRNGRRIERLESRIRYAAYKAEDIIELHFASRLLSDSTEDSLTSFNQALEKVIEEINTIKQEVMQIEDDGDEPDLKQSTTLSSNPASGGKSTVVGLDDDLMEIKTRLIIGSPKIVTIAIVGMGGIGKTTLSRHVYNDTSVKQHFDVCAWVTVSQVFDMQRILIDILDSMKKSTKVLDELRNEDLAECLYKNLKGRRYLIVLDDIWDTEVWDRVHRFFPNDNNGSRIILTTRQEKVAAYASPSSHLHRIHFLNDNASWNLFCHRVFGKHYCPLELKEVGKKIVRNCQGLPLSLVVIGGLLSKAPRTESYWTSVLENLTSTITSNDEKCSRVLSLSYNHLPHHLKGCFLFIGIFNEGYLFRVAHLIKLWIAEGFIKPTGLKRLEDAAEEYLLNLVERGLVLVDKRYSSGKIRTCMIHDLLRDLCVRQAERDRFFHVDSRHVLETSKGVSSRRIIVRHSKVILHHDAEGLLPRSFFFFNLPELIITTEVKNLRLLRVLYISSDLFYFPTGLLEQLVGLRYLFFEVSGNMIVDEFFSSVLKLRHLQTLIVPYVRNRGDVKLAIWEMQELRHVLLWHVILLDPPASANEGENSVVVLENLLILSRIQNFRCTEEVVKRIPNIMKLDIYYADRWRDFGYYCLHNLVSLQKLEELKCEFCLPSRLSLKNLTFPVSLKKLTLIRGFHLWEEMKIVGSLPNLRELKLKRCAFYGPVWEPNEGEFLELKFLQLDDNNLKHWRAEAIHFPSLQFLVIKNCKDVEIPSGIGEIPTLQSIEVLNCGDSVVTSAKQIKSEQESWGNEILQVLIQGDK